MNKVLKKWTSVPKQKRSQESLERIVNTAKDMLIGNSFENASVQMIVKNAKSSVGSFYNHFATKENLLNYILDEYEEQLVETVKNFCEDEDHANLNLSEKAKLWITVYLNAAIEEKGLLRTRVLYSMQNPDKVSDFRKAMNAELMTTTRAFFDSGLSEIKHPQKSRALDFVLSIIDKAIAYQIFLEGYEDHLLKDINKQELIEEYHNIFISYLGIKSWAT